MSDSTTRPHNISLLDEILAGTVEPEEIRRILNRVDRKGLTPVSYAALTAARNSEDLLALRALLDPPQKEEQSQMDLVLELLERIGASQVRAEQAQAENKAVLKQVRTELRELRTEVDQAKTWIRSLAQSSQARSAPRPVQTPPVRTSTPPEPGSSAAARPSASPQPQAAGARRLPS